MKIFNLKKGAFCHKFLLMTIGVILISSCEDSIEQQIVSERFTIAEIQLKTTAVLPLLVGKDSLINIVIKPENVSNNKLTLSSSNPAVATISEDGKISAKSVGTTTISAVSTDGSARKASIEVQVIDHIDLITDINFTNAATSLYEKESLSLNAVILPANATYKTLKWTSSDTRIASVSETGEVKGLSKGTVTVTAAATDGSGVKKTINLEIKEVIPVTRLVINTVVTQPLAPGQVLALDLAVTPANATVSALTWSSSDAAIASVTNTGIVRALTEGQAVITVASKEGVKATISITVEAGKIDDNFISGTNWFTPTANAVSVIENNLLKVTMAGNPNKRGDFRRTGGATVHAGRYPIIAFKFNRPLSTAGNVIFDTNLGRYMQHVANGNNRLTTVTGRDGVQVHYANIAAGSFGTTETKLSATAPTVFSAFTVVIADFPAAQLPAGGDTYFVHWIKSFKTETELLQYINQ